jgi:cytochrome c
MAEHGGPVKGIAVAGDGIRALTAGFDYSLILWDLNREQVLERLIGHEAAVNAVDFLPGGKTAVSVSDDGTLARWDLSAGRLEDRRPAHRGKAVDVAVSGDGRFAASAGWDQTVRIYDLGTGREHLTLEARANVNCVAFTADGGQILAGDAEGTLYAWRVADGVQERAVKRHDFAITGLVVHPHGRTAVTSSVDETVQVWDLASFEVTLTLYGHEGPALAVALSPDGRLVASGGVDGTVRVWRRGDGDRLKVYDRRHGPVWSVAFTEDGAALLSGGADGLLVTYDLASPKPEPAPAGRTPGSSSAERESPNQQILDDGSRGAKLFRTCAACHTVTPDGKHRAGPTLHGLFGRRAGSRNGYPYSKALKSADLVWTEETVSRLFEVGPEVLTPGSKMPLQRMPDPDDRADLIAYLKRVTAEKP